MKTDVDEILKKAQEDTASLTDDELALLLDLTVEDERQKLFCAARHVREKYFGGKIFLYGFVYFSTYCRNSCTFCYYRRNNAQSPRYRKTPEEILRAAMALKASGVHLLDLTMGEDPYYLSSGEEGYARLIRLVREIHEQVQLPVMISPGVVPENVLERLRMAGADWYACYQETHTRSLYEKLRLDQSYDERWSRKLYAKQCGFQIEEGLLVGIGETLQDIVHSLREMQKLDAGQVRTMTFVPQSGTPLGGRKSQGDHREINLIAVMRLLFAEKLLPASLDIEGVQGLKERLAAGANVVTSLIPSTAGLAGVAQADLEIADGCRSTSGVLPVLESCGLSAATVQEYRHWLARNRRMEGIV